MKRSLKIYDVFASMSLPLPNPVTKRYERAELSKYQVLAYDKRSAIKEVVRYRREMEGRKTIYVDALLITAACDGVVLTN
jgi:hypothetical protein